MLQPAIFILGLIASTISAQTFAQNLEQNIAQTLGQNSLPNESQNPPEQQQNDVSSSQQFTLQALMQISNGTEKFSLELYKVISSQIVHQIVEINFVYSSRD